MPRKRKEAVRAVCAECGEQFETTRSDARFCPSGTGKASPCQTAYRNRMTSRGAVLAPYVLAWISGKGGGHSGVNPTAAAAMRELTSIARGFLDEDKGTPRLPALAYVEGLLANGLYIDRKSPKRRGAA